MAFSPVDCTWINAVSGSPSYTDVELRRADTVMFAGAGDTSDPLKVRGGIVRHASNSLAVSVDGSDVVTVQAGGVVIPGDDTAGNGVYRAAIGTSQTATLAARDATNARIDLLVFEVINAGTQAQLRIITGTPSGSPAVPAKPNRSVEITRIPVPALGGGTASVDSSKVTYAAAAGGVIPCTSTTRPTHVEGQPIYEADTDLLLVSDGSAWRVVSDGGALPMVEALDQAQVGVNANTESTIYSATLSLGSVRRRVSGSFTHHFDTAGTNVAAWIYLKVNGTIIARSRYHTDSDSPGVPRMGSITCVASDATYTGDVTVTLTVANDAASDSAVFIKHNTGRFRGVPC